MTHGFRDFSPWLANSTAEGLSEAEQQSMVGKSCPPYHPGNPLLWIHFLRLSPKTFKLPTDAITSVSEFI